MADPVPAITRAVKALEQAQENVRQAAALYHAERAAQEKEREGAGESPQR